MLLSAPMRTTRLRANTAQEPKGQGPWKPSFRLRGSGVNPAGAPHPAALTAQSQAASPAPPRGPPQGHAGRDTGTEEMCLAIGGGEGVTHCPRPQATSSGSRRGSLTCLAPCYSTSAPTRHPRDPPTSQHTSYSGVCCGGRGCDIPGRAPGQREQTTSAAARGQCTPGPASPLRCLPSAQIPKARALRAQGSRQGLATLSPKKDTYRAAPLSGWVSIAAFAESSPGVAAPGVG